MNKPKCGYPNERGEYAIGTCAECGIAEMIDPIWLESLVAQLDHCGECPNCYAKDHSITIHRLKEV